MTLSHVFRYKQLPLILLLLATIVLTLQNYLIGSFDIDVSPYTMTHYNNFLIFRQSFYHLIHQQDLYSIHPADHQDLFKYSPSFALLMAPVSVLPVVPGLLAWNILNALVFYYGFRKLPFKTEKRWLIAFCFIAVEMVTSLQNLQSNCLVAGLVLLAFYMMERKNIAIATLLIVLTIFIKLIGIIALAIILLYPRKSRAILYTIFWSLLIALLPLVVISPAALYQQYLSWIFMLINDHASPDQLSIFGWLRSWFGVSFPGFFIVAAGAFLLFISLGRERYFNRPGFRLLFLASILIFMVIFNHKAESPTYIIACTGVAIWFFCQPFSLVNAILVGFVLIFTILSPTDLFPDHKFLDTYCIKAFPCILVWIKTIWDLGRYRADVISGYPGFS